MSFRKPHEMGQAVKQAVALVTGLESARNRRDIARAALKLAHDQMSDEDARRRLYERTRETPRAARRALKTLRAGRDEFDRDRAYRLLEASISNTPVQPIAPPRAELFLREEALGRQPIGEAFMCLKELVSAVGELESAVGQEHGNQPDTQETQPHFESMGYRLAAMVGPAAPERLDPLARSQLALTIATQYFAILGGESRYGNLKTSYFSAPHKLYIRSGAIGGSLPEPPSPL